VRRADKKTFCAAPHGSSGLRFRLARYFFENRRRCHYAVAFLKTQQSHALRRAAGFANLAGMDANDFPLPGDDHHVRIFLHLQRGDDGAIAFGGLEIDDAFTAA
jgi:hypothetical protein